MRKLRTLIAVSLLVAVCTSLSWAAPADDFAEGNKHFQNREYSKAIESYSRIVQQGYESAAVYYNLANSYFKDGNLGYAVLYYLKARRLNPTDSDINNNLEFAKRLTTVQLEGAQLNPINSLMEGVVAPFKLNTLAWLASLAFILLIVFLSIRFGLGIVGGAVKAGIVASLVLLIVLSLITTYKYHHDYVIRWGVVVSEQAQVFAGPSETASAEFQSEPGLVVQILSESGEYYEVLFENQRQGWVKKGLVAEV